MPGSGFWEKDCVDVLIATPMFGNEMVYNEVAENRREMKAHYPKGLRVQHMRFPEPVIDISRDKAVQTAIQMGARWLLMLDADIICPVDVLERLLNHDKPIVSGHYVRRHNPPFNEMLRLRADGAPGLRPIQDGEYTPGELVDCDAVATGCVLMDTGIFEKVKPFQMTIDGQPCRPAYFLWTEWRMNGGASEDFAFFVRAKQSGIPVFCDTSIALQHMGPVKFSPSYTNQMNIKFPGEA